jgi:hypothetical protein
MAQYVGLDVSLKETKLHVADAARTSTTNQSSPPLSTFVLAGTSPNGATFS